METRGVVTWGKHLDGYASVQSHL